MKELTLGELTRILRECAGQDETVDLDRDILDVPFADLGYDSLALLETAARIRRDHGITLADDGPGRPTTPRALLDEANSGADGADCTGREGAVS